MSVIIIDDSNSISGIFNTDGVQLYSSSKVKLWPIYVAINEIPLKQRFAKENMILAGLWQGKGQPPYFHYMAAFGEEMSKLYFNGVDIDLKGRFGKQTVKFGVFLGSLDLPAKCKVLNMTQYNGMSGCSTCEEPGERAQQGKGTTQYYPSRPPGARAKSRSTEAIKNSADHAAVKNQINGVIGHSGLSSMPWFDYVLGIVPEYMHGSLLGVTKTLMYLWFSPTSTKIPYFIGNKLNKLKKVLYSMKPPDYIERLPRDLEKH